VEGRQGEKLAVDRERDLVVIGQVLDPPGLHIFDANGNLVHSINLETAVPRIGKHCEDYRAGQERCGYAVSGFALAGDGNIIVCGRHDRLYIVSYEGSYVGEVLLPSDDWQEDIAVDKRGRIYILYQNEGILIIEATGKPVHHILNPQIYYCRRISVDLDGAMYITGQNTAGPPKWANSICKVFSNEGPIKEYSHLTNVFGITVDNGGNVYSVEMSDGTLLKFTNELDLVDKFALNLPNKTATAIDVDAKNNCYVLTRGTVAKFELPI